MLFLRLILAAISFSLSCGENIILNKYAINPKVFNSREQTSYLRGLNRNRIKCESVWNSPVEDSSGTYTCGQRITWLKSSNGGKLTADEAQDKVASDFPSICGPCGEKICDDVWDSPATDRSGTYSCGERITWLMSVDGGEKTSVQAKNQIANKHTIICGPCSETKKIEPLEDETCNAVWDSPAIDKYGDFTCGERIEWLRSSVGGKKSDKEAKNQIAAEFPFICGSCGSDIVSETSSKCGGAVNAGQSNCETSLWEPSSSPAMHCYAYGGKNDPCALHNNNDYKNGFNKDPSECQGDIFDTFYLWDEPDTQGKSYSWAGTQWAAYAKKYKDKIQSMRQKGIKFTSPLITAGSSGAIKKRARDFFQACGNMCRDPNSSAYIDIIAINAFCGPWNIDDQSNPQQGCRNGVSYIVNEIKKLSSSNEGGNLPVYITNWSRLHVSKATDQLAAMDATDAFFMEGSPVQRVYWFGAEDYGGGSSKNLLTDSIKSGIHAGKTLGEVWNKKCKSL